MDERGKDNLRVNRLLAAMEKIPNKAIVVFRGIGRENIIHGSSGFLRESGIGFSLSSA